MKNETQEETYDELIQGKTEKKFVDKYTLPISVVIAGVIISMAMVYSAGISELRTQGVESSNSQNIRAPLVDGGNILPLETEENILATLIDNGTISPAKLPKVTELNLLWAFGLANKNPILENGPIMDTRYGGPTSMASVGGWSVTTGSVMDHYNKHILATLTSDQQALVERIAKGIYRPCCDNSTYFPDCNHGMAMLGLLEYLASGGATEDQLWNAAVTANMSWFPDQYQVIAQYFKQNGTDWRNVSQKDILGIEYSSASGFAKIASEVVQPQQQGGSGCGV